MKAISNPTYSIVVSVYNSGKTLERCMESLVTQTYNDVKIIVVDKESTDNSKEIERFYEQAYPEKVKVYHRPYSNNAAAGRSYGIQMAETDYIAFCDADDYMDVSAIERLNQYILANKVDYDMICYGTYLTKNGDVTSVDRYKTPLKKEHLLMGNNCMGFWNKLIKRQLLLECGEVFDSLLDDIGYLPLVISRADKIGCLNVPLYFFEQVGGASHREDSPVCLELLKSLDNVLNNIAAKDLGPFAVCAATRLINHIKQNPFYEDTLIAWLKRNRAYFVSNSILKTKISVYRTIMDYVENYEYWVPKRIYINGFGGVDDLYLQTLKSSVFYGNDAEIIVLDETVCLRDQNPYAQAAYECKEYEFLAQWYALKEIYEHGGIYISHRIQVKHYLTEIRKYGSFFSQIRPDSFSGAIFGGCPNVDIFMRLLETYHDGFYENRFASLEERLNNIIEVLFSASPDDHDANIGDIYILSPTQIAIDVGDEKNLCVYQFENLNVGDTAITIDSRVLSMLQGTSSTQETELKALRMRCVHNEKELAEIKASDSYKLSMLFKRIGNTRIGYIPKKVFKKLLAVYRKFKRIQ